MIGFRWNIYGYEPQEKTYETYKECKKNIYPEYLKEASIDLVVDIGGIIEVIKENVVDE